MAEITTFRDWCAAATVIAPLLLVAALGIVSLFDRRFSERATAWFIGLTTGTGLIATLGVFAAMQSTGDHHVVLDYGSWVHLDAAPPLHPYHFELKFVFDRLSIPFTALIFVLFGTIAAFAVRYMHREPGYNRFFVLYSIFLAGMVLASLAGTIETLFLGWELVGLSSTWLIGFFQERAAPVRNAFRVWVIYRVSDAALLLAALLLHSLVGSGDFDDLFGYKELVNNEGASWPFGTCGLEAWKAILIGSLLLVAAAGKSALVPFCGWLPRAMEGPTPSSAVFYGALSVHLGAYLLLRLDPLLDVSPLISAAVVMLGLATAAVAVISGRAQTDIKSILAFASLTQVGLIVAEIGFGWRYIPLVHLLGHACLRTLQFVRAPSAIRDHNAIEFQIGGRLPRVAPAGSWRNRLYHFAFERGHLDSILDRFVVGPFLGLFRMIDRMERRVITRLSPPRPETPNEPRA